MTDESNGSSFVRITNREVYDKLSNLERVVNSMDGRMNSVLEDNVALSKRVRGLELKFYSILAGLITTGGGALLVFIRGGG